MQPLPSPAQSSTWSAWMRGAMVLCALVCGLLVVCIPADARASDSLTCKVDDEAIICEADIEEFLSDEIRDVLNNGWENTLLFNLLLLDEDNDVVGLSYSELSQRCYIDPFDDPCLALWSGSETWDSHQDVDAFIEETASFKLRSVPVSSIPKGTYKARLNVELNPITEEQVNVIRSWLARNRGGHLVVGKSESSIFGTFVSVFANVRPGHAEAFTTVESNAFKVE